MGPRGVGEDRAPDEKVHGDVDEIGDDAGVVAQTKRENVDEADANEFRVNLQAASGEGLRMGSGSVCVAAISIVRAVTCYRLTGEPFFSSGWHKLISASPE